MLSHLFIIEGMAFHCGRMVFPIVRFLIGNQTRLMFSVESTSFSFYFLSFPLPVPGRFLYILYLFPLIALLYSISLHFARLFIKKLINYFVIVKLYIIIRNIYHFICLTPFVIVIPLYYSDIIDCYFFINHVAFL